MYMKNPSIDVRTVELIARLMKPDPTAPIIPTDFTKGSEGAFGMAKDIAYLTKTVDEIKAQLKEITEKHVTIMDFTDHTKYSDKAHLDFENRIRVTESEVQVMRTQLRTWGASILFLTGAVQIISHFWK